MGTRTRPFRLRRATLAIAFTLVSSVTRAATLTCQDRSVRAIAEWAELIQADSARAADSGVFDDEANAGIMFSYTYIVSEARARQVSQVVGSTLQAMCTAEAQFLMLSEQTGGASAASHLEFCIRLDRAATVTLVARASGRSWSDAVGTSQVVFAGPGGLSLELVRHCTSGVCDSDSLLAVTMPIPAGDYALEATADARAAGSAGENPGNWIAKTSIEVFVDLNEPITPVARTTWGAFKGLYRDTTR